MSELRKNPHGYLTDPLQIEAAESLVRLDDAGHLYHMNTRWNYYQIPEAFKPLFAAGCSVFVTKNPEGDVLFCRSYDYSHFKNNDRANNPRTGINVVTHCQSPAARFRSVGVADAFWLDHRHGSYAEGCFDDGVTDISPVVMVPHICMDGLNEQGLCLCILALPVEAEWTEVDYAKAEELKDPDKRNFELTKPGEVPTPTFGWAAEGSIAVNTVDQKAWVASVGLRYTANPGKQTVLHTTMMRIILDNCTTVDEAVAYASTMNVTAPAPGMDFHIMIADATGKSRLLEWRGNEMRVVETDHATNFFLSKNLEGVEDRFGLGMDRYDVIDAAMRRFTTCMTEETAENVLQLVCQDPDNGTDKGKTQWSCIYNLTKKTVKLFSWGDFSRSWEFTVEA